jgi:hypothetical protein
VTFPHLLTINHERQKPLFCPKTLTRQALELQVFRPESLLRYLSCRISIVNQINSRLQLKSTQPFA